jgi:hypothetical protein
MVDYASLALVFGFVCYCEDELQRGELVELIQPRNPPLNRLHLAYTARNIRMPHNRAVRDTLLKAKAQWWISVIIIFIGDPKCFV